MPPDKASGVPAREALKRAPLRPHDAGVQRTGDRVQPARCTRRRQAGAWDGRSVLLMWLDALIVVAIVFLAWSGARSGAAVAGLRLASLPLAYAGAVGAAWAFGPALARAVDWPELGGSVVAGSAGLMLASTLLTGLTRLLRRDEAPEPTSQALGAVFGVLRGALFALPILWLAGLAEGARLAGVQPDLPDLSGAQLPALSGSALGAGARSVLDERTPGGRVTLALVSRPAETVESLQQVLRDPHVGDLQRDGSFWQDVERGAVSAALARPAARKLVNDRTFRARLAKVGAVSPDAARDAHRFEAELALALAELGPRLEAVRSDPAFAALAQDPEVLGSLRSGNTLTLFGDARFRALVARATR